MKGKRKDIFMLASDLAEEHSRRREQQKEQGDGAQDNKTEDQRRDDGGQMSPSHPMAIDQTDD
ncbi:hypothetical protein IWW45_008859 [Coemansia sp. RSA 485]|nr:hypothetical protein IWW45_008859 [Coemansia sp. RSA 485]